MKKNYYLVILKDNQGEGEVRTFCYSDDDLGHFLVNIDKQLYEVMDIIPLGRDIFLVNKEFLKKDENLELGQGGQTNVSK